MSNPIFADLKNPKKAGISHMDWAQQIKMDHDPNIRKDPVKVKKDPHKIFLEYYLPIS